MSNIKLKDHYWEASGIYDKNKSKTQSEINDDIDSALNSANIFFGISELGLSGTPTMTAVTLAMPNHSIGVFNFSEIDQSALENTSDVNVITIIRYNTTRCYALGCRAYDGIPVSSAHISYAAYNTGSQSWSGWQKVMVSTDSSLPIANGGTGATSASAARTNLGLGTVSTLNTVPIANGGTGATDASNAKANLGLGTASQNLTFNDSTSNGQMASFRFYNKNSLSSYTDHNIRLVITDVGLLLWDGTDSQTIWSLGTPIGVAYGGTGASTAAGARTNLGLGSVAVESTVPIDKGGTNATTDTDARINLGLTYKVNDTFTINASAIFPGTITGGSKDVYLDCITDKSMENISTVTVSSMSGTIRGTTGILDSAASNVDFTSGSFTATASKLSNNKVRILVRKSSAFTNVTNNTPVVYWGTIRLTFT